DRASTILRDILTDEFTHIHVNDDALYDEVKSYVQEISPDLEKIVRLYRHKEPIFDHFGVEKQIKASFGKTVNLQGCAYLVIEHREALQGVEVNSGNRIASKESQEEMAKHVNREAAKEIARQLRLREMGGIVVIDFIDMHKPAKRKGLYGFLKECLARARAK